MTAGIATQDFKTPSELINAKIAGLGDWRGQVLARMRRLILKADPDIVEAVKWRKPTNPAGVPVWELKGIICTGEIYKAQVKLTFAKGALLPDPAGLFNGSLNGHMMRAVDIERGRNVDGDAFIALVRAAIDFNHSKGKG